ncbi:MAG: cupin [Alphaproteobacteria bacterium]|nr:cupin [Alphaproteobacteria bacterium]
MKTQSKHLNSNKMQVISRSSIPVISSIEMDGIAHELGKLFDFRKHPDLASFIPENARPSFAWTNLELQEELAAHEHPTPSMIIICQGEGEVFGDCEQKICAGDVIIVPPYHQHGFRTQNKDGFWALSVQFEGPGLYENTKAPRVEFVEEREKLSKTAFDSLLKDQEQFVEKFKKHPLIQLVQSMSLEDKKMQERLLEALNIWGNWFQRIIYMRAATGSSGVYQTLAEQHIQEEVGHNTSLLKMRGNKEISLNDPILEATASWFFEKMLSLTVEEKTVLIHFVVEAAGDVFHTEALHLFHHTPHFQTHVEHDEDHFGIGCRVLEAAEHLEIEQLRLILSRGWEMMDLLLSRIAYFTHHGGIEKETDTRYDMAYAKAS